MNERTPPFRRHTADPDGGAHLSPRAIKALRALVLGDNEDRSPSLKTLERVLAETACTEDDRASVLFVVGITEPSKE